ncbi:cis-aconitate decarboxylase [Stigmatopora argus]
MLRQGVTQSFGATVHALGVGHLTNEVVRRSKRMILDTLGVGLLGSTTDIFTKALRYSQLFRSEEKSTIWGKADKSASPHFAAFVNGVAVHSMDFDDTWYPATHPSGAVLAALLALAEVTAERPSGADLLLAFNVGVEVQGRLLRFSREAFNIPKRFHPPSVVGVMGSAAACAKLLALSPGQCVNALAIAACSAGAPLANAGTQSKPLHVGFAAQRGLEAARLARAGIEGNPSILDVEHGYGVYYQDYEPRATSLPGAEGYHWLLEDQDVALKRAPAHLGTHWLADAASAARAQLPEGEEAVDRIERVTLKVPPSEYVHCSFPATEHQARHSFQFNACSAILDGGVGAASFGRARRERPRLRQLLNKVEVRVPADNRANFEEMYGEVAIQTREGRTFSARCDTFYGHWRKPLRREDLVDKFTANALSVLSAEGAEGLLRAVDNMEMEKDCTSLTSYLRMSSEERHDGCVALSQRQ